MAIHLPLRAQESDEAGPNEEESSLEQQERRVNRTHFEQIYQAIQAYRKDHHDNLPNWLSDLVPQYLADTNCLMSPTQIRTGEVGQYFIPDPKLPTSYNYEFNDTPAARFIEGETEMKTMQDWKKKQMEVYGTAVPLVRCLHASQNYALNLAWSGEIYETGIGWETHTNTLALVQKDLASGRLRPFPSGTNYPITVTDAETRNPLAEAELDVEVNTDRGWFPLIRARTDAQGKAQIPLPNTQNRQLNATATAKGHIAQRASVNLQSPKRPASLTMVLNKAAQVSGVVKADDGKPIAGAAVVIPGSSYRAETDAQGRWTLEGLPPGFRNQLLTVTHPDYRTERINTTSPATEIILQPKTIVKGTVQAVETGKPLRKFMVISGAKDHRGVRWGSRKGMDQLKGQFTLRFDQEPPDFLRFEAEGYEPYCLDDLQKTAAGTALEVKLQRSTVLDGRIELPDGQPAEGAQLLVLDQFTDASVSGEKLMSATRIIDQTGRFSLAVSSQAYGLAAAHSAGYAEIGLDELKRTGKVVLKPWHSVQGTLQFSARPPYPSLVLLTRDFTLAQVFQGPHHGQVTWDFSSFVQEGLNAGQDFTFENVMPGGGVFWKATFFELNSMWRQEQLVFNGVWFSPGKDKVISLQAPQGYRLQSQLLSEKPWAWNTLMGFLTSKEAGGAIPKIEMAFTLAEDGHFCLDGVPERLPLCELRVYQPPMQIGRVVLPSGQTVAENQPGKLRKVEPLPLTPVTVAAPGEVAPDFILPELGDSRNLQLSKFQGKFVLLDFWASWSQPGLTSAEPLKQVLQEYRDAKNLVVLGVNLDSDPAWAQQCRQRLGMSWPQASLGPWWQTDLPARYGATSLPATCLVDPQGRLLAANLSRQDLLSTIKKHLAPSPSAQ